MRSDCGGGEEARRERRPDGRGGQTGEEARRERKEDMVWEKEACLGYPGTVSHNTENVQVFVRVHEVCATSSHMSGVS